MGLLDLEQVHHFIRVAGNDGVIAGIGQHVAYVSQRLWVVIHRQDARKPGNCRPSTPFSLAVRLSRGDGQREGEAGAMAAATALSPDAATVGFDDALAYRKAQAVPFGLRFSTVYPGELLEQVRELVRGNPLTLVTTEIARYGSFSTADTLIADPP